MKITLKQTTRAINKERGSELGIFYFCLIIPVNIPSIIIKQGSVRYFGPNHAFE